jgi:hypothetical protein
MVEQRNAYLGSPERPVVRVGLMALDGSRADVTLLADTGNPFAIIVSRSVMRRLKRRVVSDVNTNFGLLKGRWFHLFMPEFGLDRGLVGYASDAVANSTKQSDAIFDGLAGLPFLRLLEFGGDADWFWLRSSIARP